MTICPSVNISQCKSSHMQAGVILVLRRQCCSIYDDGQDSQGSSHCVRSVPMASQNTGITLTTHDQTWPLGLSSLGLKILTVHHIKTYPTEYYENLSDSMSI